MKIIKQKSINITSKSWKAAKKDIMIRAYVEEPKSLKTTTMPNDEKERFYDLLGRATKPISPKED